MDRAERRRRNAKFITRGKKLLQDWHIPVTNKNAGRCRKTKALDCGKTKCFLCSSHKVPRRELTRQEIKVKLSFEEQKKE